MKQLVNCFSKAAILLIFSTTFFQPIQIFANDNNDDKQQRYIDTYSTIAIEEMHRSGIPASITLAQGILESQWGEGGLATESKNHFGIKCKEEWQGEKHYYKDDDLDENGNLIPSCFRVYERVEDSYIDHTNFLVERKYYKELFDLSSTNYKGWAHGLKKCGYATDPAYGRKLIKIIETYSLHIFDEEVSPAPTFAIEEENEPEKMPTASIELPSFSQINHAAPGIQVIDKNDEMPMSAPNSFIHKIETLPGQSGAANYFPELELPAVSEVISSGGRIQAIERKSKVKIKRR